MLDNPFWIINYGLHLAIACFAIATVLLIALIYLMRHK